MDFLAGLYDRPETEGTAKASPEPAESSASPTTPEPSGEPSGAPVVIRAEVQGDGPRLPWPDSLADWVMLLAPDDLPERFHLRQGVEVVDSTRFLASLRRDIGRGPSGPRARYGALQRDILNLHSALLGGQTTARDKCETPI